MNKLPFVWHLNYRGTISTLIGNLHEDYAGQEIEPHLHKKHALLVESKGDIPQIPTEPLSLEDHLILRAQATDIDVIPLETRGEKDRHAKLYARAFLHQAGRIITPQHRIEVHAAYNAGDIELLRKLQEKEQSVLKKALGTDYSLIDTRNTLLVERSLPYLRSPAIIAVGVSHFLAGTHMIGLYQEKGMRVTRINEASHG